MRLTAIYSAYILEAWREGHHTLFGVTWGGFLRSRVNKQGQWATDFVVTGRLGVPWFPWEGGL